MKRIYTFILIAGLLLVMTGCQEEKNEISVTTSVPTPKNHMEIINIYSIDPDTLTLVPVSVKKEDGKLSAEYIISLVLNNLSEYNIRTPELKKSGKKLYVSFSSKGEPVKNCNKKVEKLILECFANSLLDNIETCEDIIFQVEGNAYKSDNFDFKRDEVYTSR